ncbi:DUF1641 domain-containing protein [Marinococcus halophilus]|uniref:DUF1641 domain-containing protein n=1 Tax=Marinococcus halophilus TaxID=1371 RepID=A0A510Y1Q9_MARHA|nr:DUF1641 domain-containing protein [Marinococcus halophilus]OZT81271.1 DUF1641 domain-containing protein [Marinococcus halophilus]GEK57214.1 hypothetical protein MHA01_01190 [Marinococcus halophilus]
MAERITHIEKLKFSEEELKQRDMEELQSQLLDNKESLEKMVRTANLLDESGLLDMANGLLSEGDKVLNVAVNAMNTEGSTNMLKNLLLLAGEAGKLDVESMQPILLKLNKGLERVAKMEEEKEDTKQTVNIFQLLKLLRDPEVNHTLSLGIAFMRGMGETGKPEMEREQNERKPDTKV